MPELVLEPAEVLDQPGERTIDLVVDLLGCDAREAHREIGELEQTIGSDPSTVCLELSELRSIDAAALVVLRRLRDEGLQMIDVPQHLARRIEDA